MGFEKLLVLDLDETLVFATETGLDRRADARVGPYLVYRRPGVVGFLDWAEAAFEEVAIWTASSRSYALPVIDATLGGRDRFAFVWSSERCTRSYDWETGDFVIRKDLVKLRRKGYDPRRVLAVDDTPSKWSRSYGNVVAVRPFEGAPDDDELAHLQRYLHGLGDAPNVRAIEKRGWRTRSSSPSPSGG